MQWAGHGRERRLTFIHTQGRASITVYEITLIYYDETAVRVVRWVGHSQSSSVTFQR